MSRLHFSLRGLLPVVCAAVLLLAVPPGLLAQHPVASRVIALEIVQRSTRGPEVVAGKPAGAVKLRRGEQVVLRWQADEPVTLHLHGYNLSARVTPGSAAEMSFRARATGRFAVETHGIGTDAKLAQTLLCVEVHPR